jgi:hypothetical protein
MFLFNLILAPSSFTVGIVTYVESNLTHQYRFATTFKLPPCTTVLPYDTRYPLSHCDTARASSCTPSDTVNQEWANVDPCFLSLSCGSLEWGVSVSTNTHLTHPLLHPDPPPTLLSGVSPSRARHLNNPPRFPLLSYLYDSPLSSILLTQPSQTSFSPDHVGPAG